MPTESSTRSRQRHDLVDAVMRGSQVLMAITARSLAGQPDDVTLPQHRMLVVLATRGPQRLRELAAGLSVNPSTATRMCDRLHRKGLISRRSVHGDRRAVELVLTDRGRALVDQVLEQRRAEVGSVLSALSAQQRERVADGLQILADAAGESAHPSDDAI